MTSTQAFQKLNTQLKRWISDAIDVENIIELGANTTCDIAIPVPSGDLTVRLVNVAEEESTTASFIRANEPTVDVILPKLTDLDAFESGFNKFTTDNEIPCTLGDVLSGLSKQENVSAFQLKVSSLLSQVDSISVATLSAMFQSVAGDYDETLTVLYDNAVASAGASGVLTRSAWTRVLQGFFNQSEVQAGSQSSMVAVTGSTFIANSMMSLILTISQAIWSAVSIVLVAAFRGVGLVLAAAVTILLNIVSTVKQMATGVKLQPGNDSLYIQGSCGVTSTTASLGSKFSGWLMPNAAAGYDAGCYQQGANGIRITIPGADVYAWQDGDVFWTNVRPLMNVDPDKFWNHLQSCISNQQNVEGNTEVILTFARDPLDLKRDGAIDFRLSPEGQSKCQYDPEYAGRVMFCSLAALMLTFMHTKAGSKLQIKQQMRKLDVNYLYDCPASVWCWASLNAPDSDAKGWSINSNSTAQTLYRNWWQAMFNATSSDARFSANQSYVLPEDFSSMNQFPSSNWLYTNYTPWATKNVTLIPTGYLLHPKSAFIWSATGFEGYCGLIDSRLFLSPDDEIVVVDAIPTDYTAAPADFTLSEVTQAVVIVGLTATALTVAGLLARRAFTKLSTKTAIRKKTGVDNLRRVYESDKTPDNYKRYYTASRRYDRFLRRHGMGGYNMLSGSITPIGTSSTNAAASLSTPFDLMKGVADSNISLKTVISLIKG